MSGVARFSFFRYSLRRFSYTSWLANRGIFVMKLFLLVMLAAGELSLTVIDSVHGHHPHALFVGDAGRFEEWIAMHGTLESTAVEAVRSKLPELEDKDIGHQILVLYTPQEYRRRLREPSSDIWQGNL